MIILGLTSPRELWEQTNGKAVGSDDTWEAYCQRRKDDADKLSMLFIICPKCRHMTIAPFACPYCR